MDTDKHCKMGEEMAEVFKALGDTNRLFIIHILASQEMEKISVTDLAKMLGVTQPAASQHLKTLRGIGILDARKEGYHTYYTFNRTVMQQIKDNIDFMFRIAFEKCDLLDRGTLK